MLEAKIRQILETGKGTFVSVAYYDTEVTTLVDEKGNETQEVTRVPLGLGSLKEAKDRTFTQIKTKLRTKLTEQLTKIDQNERIDEAKKQEIKAKKYAAKDFLI